MDAAELLELDVPVLDGPVLPVELQQQVPVLQAELVNLAAASASDQSLVAEAAAAAKLAAAAAAAVLLELPVAQETIKVLAAAAAAVHRISAVYLTAQPTLESGLVTVWLPSHGLLRFLLPM